MHKAAIIFTAIPSEHTNFNEWMQFSSKITTLCMPIMLNVTKSESITKKKNRMLNVLLDRNAYLTQPITVFLLCILRMNPW